MNEPETKVHEENGEVIVTVEVYHELEACSLDKFVEGILDLRGSIPAEYRTAAEVEIHSTDYDYAAITVSYTRPPTSEEWDAAVLDRARRVEREEAQERAQLERLMQKYGADA